MMTVPSFSSGQCYNFTMLAVFSDDPSGIALNPAMGEPAKNLNTAPSTEDGTFVTIQPMFRDEQPYALLLTLTRKEYLDGREVRQPAVLPKILRQAEAFMGLECNAQILGEYFLPVTDTPKPIAHARGPFTAGSAGLEVVAGGVTVSNSAVQMVNWALRKDATWKITLQGWQKGLMAPDTVAGALTEYNEFFNSFRNAEVPRG